jgi:hypothetical protein
VLAISAFVLSVVSLTSSLIVTRVRWPRIAVEAHQTVIVGEPTRDVVRLTVINHGAEAMTIRNIGLTSEGGSRKLDYQELETLRLSGLSDIDQPTGAELPCRIEGHGCLVWVYKYEMLAQSFIRDNLITAYADRYTLFRFWPWWPRRHPVYKVKRAFSYDGSVIRH